MFDTLLLVDVMRNGLASIRLEISASRRQAKAYRTLSEKRATFSRDALQITQPNIELIVARGLSSVIGDNHFLV